MATCTDTLARASEARYKQGTHELEISFGGELDLHKHFQNCTKNPGHLNFIPIDSLRMHHLPKVLRRRTTFDWIKYIAKRTVKLSVRYVSSHRQPPLPLSDYAGQDILTVGSGFMSDICLVEGKHEMPCPFDNCPEQPGQHQVYGYIIITTAAHVVFDDDEAKNTTVEFFYDNPNDRSNVRTARGVKVGTVSVEGDFCEMLCVTHDRQLLNSIENAGIKEDKNVTLTIHKVRISYSLFQDSIPTSLFSGAEVANVVNGNIDFRELQCVTHDKQLFDFLAHGDHQQNVKAIRYDEIICDLFQMFPCIKNISARDRFLMSDSQELSVNISLDNVLNCAELLVLLLTYNIETIVKAMCTLYYNRYLFSDNEEIYINPLAATHVYIRCSRRLLKTCKYYFIFCLLWANDVFLRSTILQWLLKLSTFVFHLENSGV
uniref:Uncharacterized protein n=1 Tax=Arion vulgaris TaxID=1028688 RepID=A0A0B7BPY9_9EUPU